MELWVRSQNKRLLIRPRALSFGFAGNICGVYYENGCLGEYSTEQRCLEIIDEIQKILQTDGLIFFEDIDTSGLKKEDLEPFKALAYMSEPCGNCNGEVSFNQLGSYVYEMPQE